MFQAFTAVHNVAPHRITPHVQVSLEPVDVPGASRSAIQVGLGDKQLLLILTADALEVRGADSGAPSRWAHTGVMSNFGENELDDLLSRLCQDCGL